jgi:hypothetical protein
MAGFLIMLRCMLIFRTVTAPDMAAGKAHAQAYPCVTDLNTVFTHCDIFWVNVANLVFVATGC